jgi:sugar lactone lactonase YvrE
MLVGAGSYSNSLAVYTTDDITSLFLTAVSEDGGESGRGSVIRSSVDATSTETILDLESSEPFGIDLDADEEQIYWCEKDKEAVIRSDLHGTPPTLAWIPRWLPTTCACSFSHPHSHPLIF